MAALAEDAQALRTWCKQRDQDAGDGGEAADGLHQKLQVVVQQHARHARSVEAIVAALTEDNSQLHHMTRSLDASVGLLRRCATEHHQALRTSCQVFSAALKIQSPLDTMPNLSSSLSSLNSAGASAHMATA